MTQHLKEIRSKCWEARTKWLDIGLELNLAMDDLNALQTKYSSDAEKCFTAMLNLWLNSDKQPTLTALIAALREKTVNRYAVAEELEIPRENLRQQSSAAVESDILISQDSTDFSLPPTMSEARNEKTRKRKQNSQDTRDDAEEKVERRENGQPTDTGGEIKKQEIKYAYCMGTYIILVTALVAILSAIAISALTDNTCHVIAGGKGLNLAIEAGERPFGILVNVDRNGQLCSTPMQTPTCWFLSNTSSKSNNCTITKLDKNILKISYQAIISQGRHQLHVKMEGEHIKGSPFPVVVIRKTPLFNTIIRLKDPCGVAVNQRGEILVTEGGGHSISILSPTGEFLKSFGSQGSVPGQFSGPSGVTVDDDGNILVADSGNRCIHKFTSKDIISVRSYGRNHTLPISVAISPITKKIAILDWNNHRVQIRNPDLTSNTSIGSKGSGNGEFSYPYDIAFDSEENMYVVDTGNHRIQVFNPKGKHEYMYSRQFGEKGKGDGKLDFPTGIYIDNDNIMYVTERNNHRVSLFTLEGDFLTSFGSQGYKPRQFENPCGITVDKNGKIYVVDCGNGRIQIFAKMTESPH